MLFWRPHRGRFLLRVSCCMLFIGARFPFGPIILESVGIPLLCDTPLLSYMR